MGLKTLSRILAPFLLRFVAKKAEQRFGGNFQNSQYTQKTNAKEGETVIDKMPNANKSSRKDVGEYIDFEEVD